MKYALVLAMWMFLAACNSGHQKQSPSQQTDTTQLQQDTATTTASAPAFDLNNFQKLVKKYEDPQRADWQNPELIIDKLGDLNGKTVADIGAGTGYFTFRMAEKGAKVIAIDIDNRFLDYIENRKAELSDNILPSLINTRLVKEDNPELKPQEVDYALLVNTYHFLDQRADYLHQIAQGLKPNGRLIIVDYKLGELPVGPGEQYKIGEEQAIKEITKAGFKILEVDSKSLNYQYIITAKI